MLALHPELMVHDKRKQVEDATVNNKEKNKNPLMILTGRNVVGNVGAQWKKVRDNRVQNKGKQSDENVAIDKDVTQQVQTTNEFAILEVEDGEVNESNQLVLGEETDVQKSLILDPKEVGKLNPAVTTFNPNATRIASLKRGNNTNTIVTGDGDRVAVDQGVPKESTA